MALKNLITKTKKKVIDVASDAMSFPARNKAKKVIAKNNAYLADKKLLKEVGNSEPYPNDYTHPVFRARANVSAYEAEYARRMSKR